MSIFEISILAICTLGTSAVAGVLGQGGGLILMAILSIYLDAPLLIAFHGVIQLFSNSSRAYYSIQTVKWNITWPIVIGVILGAVIVLPFLRQIQWHWLEPIIGLFILQQTWGKFSFNRLALPKPFLVIGLFQGALGMIVGATGPLANSLLLKAGLAKDEIVASNAVIMSSSHLIKIILYLALGVSLMSQLFELTLLCFASIIGSKLGTRLRGHIPEDQFKRVFKIVLSLLALRMIVSAFY